MYLRRKLTGYVWQPAIVGYMGVRRIAAQDNPLRAEALSRPKKRPNVVGAPHIMSYQYYVSHTTWSIADATRYSYRERHFLP